MTVYPASYADQYGVETTTVANDGSILCLRLRGLEFTGQSFDSLGAPDDATTEQLHQFSLHHGCLCACRIDCKIPIPIHNQGTRVAGSLLVGLVLGNSASNGFLDCEELRIALEYDHERFIGSGKSGWFEDELLEIQTQLPHGIYMQACINCLYSDYSPYGHGLFGFMMCFRSLKAEYLKVTTKNDFWRVHDRADRLVQETYLCSEFERRVPGTGYRG